MARLSDTSPEMQRMLTRIFRNMPLSQKWRRLADAYHTAKLLHTAGCRLRDPSATSQQIHDNWLAITWGANSPLVARERGVEPSDQNVPILREVMGHFSSQGIPCVLGGSMASSLLGKPRFTYDADLTAAPFPGQEKSLLARFGKDYYVSLPAVEQAVRERASFNILHTTTGFKIDVFIQKDRPFDHSLMARQKSAPWPDQPDQSFAVVSPEDIILLKLEWYRLGQGVSDRQWADILGVMEVQGERLDQEYLDHWAKELGVADLLAQARQETI
jgi:hypothetical protein